LKAVIEETRVYVVTVKTRKDVDYLFMELSSGKTGLEEKIAAKKVKLHNTRRRLVEIRRTDLPE
jgi:hypothetical protein